MINHEILTVTQLVANQFEALGISYVIGGSMASIIHGMIRTTMDVDMVADLKMEHVAPFVLSLQNQFYVDEQAARQAVQNRTSFNLIHLETMFKVDVFVPKDRAFDQQQLNRRVSEQLASDSEKRLWVLTAEDIILAKLDWFRLGGEVSERQWRDILGIMKTQPGALDIGYLQKWADELNVSDLLVRALDEMNL